MKLFLLYYYFTAKLSKSAARSKPITHWPCNYNLNCFNKFYEYRDKKLWAMFFFIAGIQPKTVYVDDQCRVCPSCGLYQARLKRADHYLSVFFLPILRVKKGGPFLECQRCGSLNDESGEARFGALKKSDHTCHHCGRALEPEFGFCPFCGKPV